MAVIGVLSGFGLWLLKIEAAFTLGLLGGLLCFIPYVGAILAAVPATLVALTQWTAYASMVILMSAGVHFIESKFFHAADPGGGSIFAGRTGFTVNCLVQRFIQADGGTARRTAHFVFNEGG